MEEFSYEDDVWAIESFVRDHYPRETRITSNKEQDKLFIRKSNAKYWASRKALEECCKNLMRDPWDVLDEMINNFEVEGIFSKQKLNKDYYNDVSETIQEIQNFLRKRRNL